MGHGGNVIEELTADHREVEELFQKIEMLPAGDTRRKALADEAIVELIRHSVAEELHLYPAVRRLLPDGDAIADKEVEDHSSAERTMKQIEGLDAEDPDFERLLGTWMREIRLHIEDEETNLFPKLRQAADADDLNQLGDKIRQAKKTAPTRPHPASPSTPPANKVLAPGAGLVDRVRDALSGRGKSS
ncbi:hemerythrin domain-containing protein [Streptomyces zingiberis]|uniref:Hemerythrin domain-containing protein n=1 Tax=Streptomyces zingiberis TaxID=2053010 RepID=A0ABX1BWT3_9ACTN|nr:hemerythrin domain-containing protein [Streptomyces zingiberis]NJQ00340.1 hemerythrin domain-containing protein [Streptomyces zingiberis]